MFHTLGSFVVICVAGLDFWRIIKLDELCWCTRGTGIFDHTGVEPVTVLPTQYFVTVMSWGSAM